MNDNLGRSAKDKITGFEGVATGYVQYLTGCHQYLITPRLAPGGNARDAVWFDEQRLTFTGKAIVLDNGKTPGFDKPAPIR